MAQSSVTGQIQKLEGELGFQVLYRDRRGVTLTPAGEALARDLAQIQSRYIQAVENARHIAMGQQREIALGYPGPPEWFGMPLFLSSFRKRYPDFRLSLRVDKGFLLRTAFESGALDILFGDMGYLSKLEEVDLIYLSRVPFYILIPGGHPLEGRQTLTRDDISGFPLLYVMTPQPDDTLVAIQDRMKAAGIDLETATALTKRENVVASVYAGMGLGLVPGTIPPSTYQVQAALFTEENLYIEIGCAYRKRFENPDARILIKDIQRSLSQGLFQPWKK